MHRSWQLFINRLFIQVAVLLNCVNGMALLTSCRPGLAITKQSDQAATSLSVVVTAVFRFDLGQWVLEEVVVWLLGAANSMLINCSIKWVNLNIINYRPQRSCEGYVFTGVCLSTREWGSASVHAGIPPGSRHPPEQTHPPREDGHCCGQYAS